MDKSFYRRRYFIKTCLRGDLNRDSILSTRSVLVGSISMSQTYSSKLHPVFYNCNELGEMENPPTNLTIFSWVSLDL